MLLFIATVYVNKNMMKIEKWLGVVSAMNGKGLVEIKCPFKFKEDSLLQSIKEHAYTTYKVYVYTT